jgi:hypothetical protein
MREYDMTPLTDDVKQTVIDFVGSVELPFTGGFKIKIVDKEESEAKIGGILRIVAPHYLMFFGNSKDENVLKNIGFAGERTVLKLTEMGIGTCWLGGTTYREKLDGEKYIICIGFGRPGEDFRTDRGQAVRRPIADMSENCSGDQNDILEYVRLAPSALNLQPWFFRCEEDRIHIFRSWSRLFFISLSKLPKIDIGVALSHFGLMKPFTIEQCHEKMRGATYECTLVF